MDITWADGSTARRFGGRVLDRSRGDKYAGWAERRPVVSMLGPWRRISPESRSVKGMGGIGSGELDGCTHVMHDRSRMAIDPRIPTMPGRST